jgi:hypothetical protein
MTQQLLSLLVLVVGAAALFGGLAFWTIRRERAQKTELHGIATRLGWRLDDSDPELAWRLTKTLAGRDASIVAKAPVSQHRIQNAPPRYVRYEVNLGLEGALLLEAKHPFSGSLGALNPIPHMVGPAYDTLTTLPEVELPAELGSGLVLRADRADRLRAALPPSALERLAAWPTSTDSPMPVVSLHQGNLRVTLPGIILRSPADLEQLVRLFEAMQSDVT